jgi:hypothetical protein
MKLGSQDKIDQQQGDKKGVTQRGKGTMGGLLFTGKVEGHPWIVFLD